MNIANHTTTQELDVNRIQLDPSVQTRASIDEDTVVDYVEAWKQGAKFPPVDVFFDSSTYRIADGAHRLTAARNAGVKEIQATVHQGNARDAFLFAARCNTHHGRRRTNSRRRPQRTPRDYSPRSSARSSCTSPRARGSGNETSLTAQSTSGRTPGRIEGPARMMLHTCTTKDRFWNATRGGESPFAAGGRAVPYFCRAEQSGTTDHPAQTQLGRPCLASRRQHFLYFFPLPHGQRLFRPTRRARNLVTPERKDAVSWRIIFSSIS